MMHVTMLRRRIYKYISLWASVGLVLCGSVQISAFHLARVAQNAACVVLVRHSSSVQMAGSGSVQVSAFHPLRAAHAARAACHSSSLQMAGSGGLGEYTVSLTKPLGIILEEREAGKPGVQVASLVEGGGADASGAIVKGDALVALEGTDLTQADFDTAMDALIAAPDDRPLDITLSDGLGRMDIAKNLAKSLSAEEAVFADGTVRAAVRKVRKIGTQLGDLLSVEIVIGAGVRDNGKTCQVRFFAIFSTDTVSTYSCSVSATGRKGPNDDDIEITQLSCAKDEGWGQTYDLIREVEA